MALGQQTWRNLYREPVKDAPARLNASDDETLWKAFGEVIDVMGTGYPEEWTARLQLDPQEAQDPTLCPDTFMWEVLCERLGVETVKDKTITILQGVIAQRNST